EQEGGVDVTRVDCCPGLGFRGIGGEAEGSWRVAGECARDLLHRRSRPDQPYCQVMRMRVSNRGADEPKQGDQEDEASDDGNQDGPKKLPHCAQFYKRRIRPSSSCRNVRMMGAFGARRVYRGPV